MDQTHAWQATLDPQAVVFTTHPTKDVPASTDWATTTGTGPVRRRCRGAPSVNRVATPPVPPRLRLAERPAARLDLRLPALHPRRSSPSPVRRGRRAVRVGIRSQGRRLRGAPLRAPYPAGACTTPPTEATNGFTRPFDLVAPGGADNAWIVEVGRAADHGSFGQFVAAIHRRTAHHHPIGGVDLGPLRLTDRGRPAVRARGTRSSWTASTPRCATDPRHSSPWASSATWARASTSPRAGRACSWTSPRGARRVT